MKRNPVTVFILLLAIVISPDVYSQIIDSTSFSMNSRLSFYSFENEAEMILEIPIPLRSAEMNIKLTIDGMNVKELVCKPGKRLFRIPFKITMPPGRYKATAKIKIEGETDNSDYSASAAFIRLDYKPNEVKVDRLTGGMVVNRKSFFPFGFYCYSPVYPTLPEEEVVKGFNMISPYQMLMPETLNKRKAYMDRCAQLGMKVHYNLLSASGGGGTGSKIEGFTDQQKREILINEIKTFMDHPALLAWYISDEPTGNKVSPEILEEIYSVVKKTDPWHPVSIVFMAPFTSSKKYAAALDIVMADPYPVPDSPVSMVEEVAGQLKKDFSGKKPLWMVPQAFGGGEWWSREPSLQELRSMTYQSIIMGASGIQYFIRHGLNSFPKSTATWGECGRMAAEIAELTPWLLSDEEPFPVISGSKNILVTSKLHDGQLIILAVNKVNEPREADIRLTGIGDSKVKVLFENRYVTINNGFMSDQISAFGSQVYMINLDRKKVLISPSPENLITDPGFEDISSPGIPASCYARPGNDRGATYFLDSREHYEGDHSLRLITPKDHNSVTIRLFPFQVIPGSSYIVSLWAKSDPEQRQVFTPSFWDNLLGRKKTIPQYVDISLGEFGSARFVPDNEWRRYVTFVTIPQDTLSHFRTNLILQMPGQGVAWFDMLQVIEDPLSSGYNSEIQKINITSNK